MTLFNSIFLLKKIQTKFLNTISSLNFLQRKKQDTKASSFLSQNKKFSSPTIFSESTHNNIQKGDEEGSRKKQEKKKSFISEIVDSQLH